MKRFLTFEKRMAGTTGSVLLIRFVSVAAALLVAVALLFCMGKTPEQVWDMLLSIFYYTIFPGYMGTIIKAIPLIITAVGISIAFRMKLWNIGGEGQIAMGAFAAAGVAMLFPGLPGWLLMLLMAAAAMIMGGLWAAIAAAPRAYLGVNETITTLMLNYVALKWLQYLVNGPWSDPVTHFPLPIPLPGKAWLPAIPGTSLHIGVLAAVALAIGYYLMIKRSRWGYEIRVVGESVRAAEYAGIDVRRNIFIALTLSGAIAGLAGMGEFAGISHRMEAGIAGGYGYTAIIIAWLARLNPWGIAAMSLFMSMLMIGSKQALIGSDAISLMLQGIILFFVLGFDLFTQYKIRFHFSKKEAKA
jgi:general nucleoside transport system permease protein